MFNHCCSRVLYVATSMNTRLFYGNEVYGMLVLITYDVNTETAGGRKRLRHIAKVCVDYGRSVQNSVFECVLDAAKLLTVKDMLLNVIEPSVDSLRFYMLGNNYKTKAEHHGAKPSFDVTDPLIL